MSPYKAMAIAALEDLLEDTHRQANKAFFKSQFARYGDINRDEATIRNCLLLLRETSHTLPVEVHDNSALAG